MKKLMIVCVLLVLSLVVLPDADSLRTLWMLGDDAPIPVMPTPDWSAKPHYPARTARPCPSCGMWPTSTPTICPSCGVKLWP